MKPPLASLLGTGLVSVMDIMPPQGALAGAQYKGCLPCPSLNRECFQKWLAAALSCSPVRLRQGDPPFSHGLRGA